MLLAARHQVWWDVTGPWFSAPLMIYFLMIGTPGLGKVFGWQESLRLQNRSILICYLAAFSIPVVPR